MMLVGYDMIITYRINAKNANIAIDAVKKAREIGLNVWYLPVGGTDELHGTPIVHRVVVRGEINLVNGWKAYEKRYV